MSCTCANSKQNLGLPSCVEVMQYTNHIILIPMRDDAGVANKIASGATVNDAYVQARLNDTDPSQRWYMLKLIKNAAIERGDNVNEEFEDKTIIFIEEGVAKMTFKVAGKIPPQLAGRIKSFTCEEMGFMNVDKGGKLWGYAGDATGDMYPIAIENQTLAVKVNYPTATTSYSFDVSFNWSKSMLDEGLAYWENTVNWGSSTISSLLDVYVDTITNISTTGFDIKLYYNFGALNSKLPVKGLVAADFVSSVGGATSKVRKTNNTPADIAITSSTESTSIPGTYSIAFAAQTAGDILQPYATKTGFDFSDLLDGNLVTLV